MAQTIYFSLLVAPIQTLYESTHYVSVLLYYRFCIVPNLYRVSATSQPSELESAEESAHSYTNIEFARESSHGTPRRLKGGFGRGSNR